MVDSLKLPKLADKYPVGRGASPVFYHTFYSVWEIWKREYMHGQQIGYWIALGPCCPECVCHLNCSHTTSGQTM